MVKTLKSLLLENQLTYDLETLYVALCKQVLPRIIKLWPWVDLDLFYAMAKFGHLGFCMGKSENMYYLETVTVIGLKVSLSIQISKKMKLHENQRSRSL